MSLLQSFQNAVGAADTREPCRNGMQYFIEGSLIAGIYYPDSHIETTALKAYEAGDAGIEISVRMDYLEL